MQQKNFSLITTDQLLLSHDQIHQALEVSDEIDCAEIRVEHDAIAAEMVRRGIEHNTGVVCPEMEVVTDAPNYLRSFTENKCANCVFGAVDQWCSLYQFQYIRDFVCDSWQPFDTLELAPPHGFLVGKGKQTAIASDVELTAEKPLLIISDSEAFGIATLDKPATMKTSEFDRTEWLEKHCIYPRERRQWWPEADKFYVYSIADWQSFKPTKLFIDGKIVDQPMLTDEQQQLAYKAKQLPKQIIVASDVVRVCEDNKFVIDPLVSNKCGLEATLAATFETDIKESDADEFLPVYSLALVRNPRMSRMSKKNESEKQEEVDMPWEVELRGDEYCVIKVDNREVEGCHDTREQANAQLAALNISEQEGESSVHPNGDEDRRRRRRKPKKDIDVKITWIEKLKSVATGLGDLIKDTENGTEVDFPEGMFKSDSGFAIKTVNGEPWHFMWSTNAFEDREGEIFSTKALEQYVLENEQKQHKGFFNFWHINEEDGNFNTDFAEKQWQGVVGRFLVEAGPYLDNENGQAALKFFQEFSDGHPQVAPEGWGGSPEFRYLPEERAKKVYDWLFIVRTSTLPRAAAANIWTQAKQEGNIMALSEQQKEAAIALLGQERVEALITEGEKRTTDLEQAGIASKENDGQQETDPVQIDLDMDELAETIGKQFEVNFGAIGEAVSVIADSLKQLQTDVEQLKNGAKVKEQTETPRYILNVKRASEAEETELNDDDELKDRKPKETSQSDSGSGSDHFFGKK